MLPRIWLAHRIASFCVKQLSEEPVREVKVVAKSKDLVPVGSEAWRRPEWVEEANQEHQGLDRRREQGPLRGRVAAEEELVLVSPVLEIVTERSDLAHEVRRHSGQPRKELLGVAQGRGEANPHDRTARELSPPTEDIRGLGAGRSRIRVGLVEQDETGVDLCSGSDAKHVT